MIALSTLDLFRCGMKQAAKTVTQVARKAASAPYEPFLSSQVAYLESCLPEVLSHIPSDPNIAAPSYFR
jgi:hypothetical protein